MKVLNSETPFAWRPLLLVLLSLLLIDIHVRLATITSLESVKNWLRYFHVAVPVLSMILYGLITSILFSLFNNIRISIGLTLATVTLLAFSHWMKMVVRGVVLYPWDFFLVREAVTVVDFQPLIGYWPNIILMGSTTALFIRVVKKIPLWKASVPVRVICFVVPLACFTSLFHSDYSVLRPWHDKILKGMWSPDMAYDRAGLGLALASELQNFFVEKPDRPYDREVMEEILRPFLAPGRDPLTNREKKINLIIFFCESLWDATQLPKTVHFDSDPIPTIRKAGQDFGVVDLISPVFGGNSCDAELEVLTGFSMRFFPKDTAPYIYYVRKAVPSFASFLSHNGYFTLMTYAAFSSYFNDYEVAPRLGFKRFINANDWSVKPLPKKKTFIDDTDTVNQIISLAKEVPKPFYLEVFTMGNHVPYLKKRRPGMTIKSGVSSEVMDKTSQEILDVYVWGLRQSDKAVAELFDYFSHSFNQPVMIVILGDHLPSLGHSGMSDTVYIKSGFFDDSLIKEDPLRKYRVQMIIWNNYGHRPVLPSTPVSMNYVPVLLMKELGMKLPPFFCFLEALQSKYPVFSVHGCYTNACEYVEPEVAEKDPLVSDYRILQWDRIFGEQYSNDIR